MTMNVMKMAVVLVVGVLCCLTGQGTAMTATPPTRTEVKSLPGWEGALPSRQWTGYLSGGVSPRGDGEQHYFYWMIECEDKEKAATAPTFIWYQGGPGGSSLFGLTVEMGPLLLNDDSFFTEAYNKTGIPSLIRNPDTVARVANLVFIDNPAPVGFSYCDPVGPSGGGTSCGNWNDSYVAVSNSKAIQEWSKVFPEYASNPVFIAGESYAGVTVPVIVRALLEDGFKVAGLGVGDGCMGTEVLCGDGGSKYALGQGPYYDIEFMHGHGQVSNKLYRTIMSKCPQADLISGKLTPECKTLVDDMNKALGGYYVYNLYDDCGQDQLLGGVQVPSSGRRPSSSYGKPPGDGPYVTAGYACSGAAMGIWLNRTDVRQAINVPLDSYFFSGDNGVGFNYTLTEPNVLPFYQHLLTDTDTRILLYNGDSDPAINSFLTQDIYEMFFEDQGIPMTTEWRPWTLDGKQRMGGYVMEWSAKSNAQFATIRGSGHLVPAYKPPQYLALITAWLNDAPLPGYVTPSL